MSGTPPIGDLKWIEEEASSQVGHNRSDFDEFSLVGNRSFKESILDKCQDNIFVPIGLISTTICLTLGLFSMRNGNHGQQQFFMRGRVGFQAFTFAAMAIGMFISNEKHKKKKMKKLGEEKALATK